MSETRWKRDSELLAYRPNLRFEDTRQGGETEITDSGQCETFSPVLTQLKSRAPYLTCQKIDEKIQVLEQCLENVERNLSPMTVIIGDKTFALSQLKTLFTDKNLSEGMIEGLEEWRKNVYESMDGNFGLEVYEQLTLCLQQLNLLRDYYHRLNYHDQLTTEEQQEQERQMILRLEELERSNQNEKVNYASVSIDVQLSEVTLNLSQTFYEFGLDLYNSYTLGENVDVSIPKGYQDKMKKVFSNYVETQTSDKEKVASYANRSMMGALFKAIQDEKDNFLNTISMRVQLDQVMQEETSVESYYRKTKNEMYQAMKELYLFNESVKQNYQDLYRSSIEKERFKQIFKA